MTELENGDGTDQEHGDITDPEVAEAIATIAKNDPDGIVQPANVVEAARDPESPLHKFIWSESDEKAAYERRLQLARSLIARVRIIRVDPGPSWVNVRITNSDGETRRGYVPTERAVIEPDLYEQILSDARRGIAGYRARLSAFVQAKEVIGHLDKALEGMRTDTE